MKELYTRRNTSECLGAAWTLMSTNLTRIAKSLWIPTLIFSLAYALLAVVALSLAKEYILNQNILFNTFASSILFIVAVATELAILAKTYKLLNEQTFKFCIKRSFKSFLIIVLLSIVALLVFTAILAGMLLAINKGSLSPKIGTALTLLVTLLFSVLIFIFFSPLSFVFTKYMVEPDTKLKHTWKNYRIGMRRLGFIIGCNLLCLLIVGTVFNITALPAYIATLAATLSTNGIANGDAAGLPSYFPFVYGVTMFIAGIVYTVLFVWYTLATYYQYASIEARNGRTDLQTEETEHTNG